MDGARDDLERVEDLTEAEIEGARISSQMKKKNDEDQTHTRTE